jgi:hypothetical protein
MRFLFLLLALVACRASSQVTPAQDVAKKELGENCSLFPNASNTFTLAVKKESSGNVSYVVIQLSSAKVILKKSNLHAEVSWNDDQSLKEVSKPGMVKKDGSSTNGTRIIYVKDYLPEKK